MSVRISAEICYNTDGCQSAGRLVIILKGMAQRKDISSWCAVLAYFVDFVPASRFLSGIPVASAEHAAGAFLSRRRCGNVERNVNVQRADGEKGLCDMQVVARGT